MKAAKRVLAFAMALLLGLALLVPAVAVDDPVVTASPFDRLLELLGPEWSEVIISELQGFKEAWANLTNLEGLTFRGAIESVLLVSGLAIFFIGAGIACIPVVLFITGPALLVEWLFS